MPKRWCASSHSRCVTEESRALYPGSRLDASSLPAHVQYELETEEEEEEEGQEGQEAKGGEVRWESVAWGQV